MAAMAITIQDLRAGHGRLLLGCRCGWQRYVDLATAPAELAGQTVKDLSEAGRWRCGGCGVRPAAMVYAHDGSPQLRQVERWRGDQAP